MQRWKYIFYCIFLTSFCIYCNSANKRSCPELLVRREILNNGFHRNLVTRVKIQGLTEQVKNCRLLLHENIPPGLYLDPYQLSSLWQQNLTEVLLLSLMDVEAPEYLSTGHTALVYAKEDESCTHCYFSTIPLHIRYHRPSATGRKVSLTLQYPKILISCIKDFPLQLCSIYPVVDAPCGFENKQVCQWLDIPYAAEPNAIIMEVPVGVRQEELAVCSLTLIVTIVCSGMLFSAVYKHGHLSV
ncbi:hypothetical protein GDO86_010334 [Hymenochirus boettgeri]|uniref:Phosphatidylinositol-glycan biosynthesis class X protein n=1 Tax=Hymenochirus boettgeri TaxID=247094 RepID=A0A8T2JJU2_9PIPI|nr:hypothetical protein GDO86_010334 [Hymenochirus boettgeri]